MASISYVTVAQAEGLTRDIYEDIMRTYGCAEPHGVYQLMGHTPEFLAASWPRSRHLYGNDSRFSLRDKHVLTLAVSATNNCEYCVRIHTDRLAGLGVSPEALTEIAMVVDVTNGYGKFAESTRAGDRPVIPAFDPARGEGAAVETYARVKADCGNKEPDALYKVMAHVPEYLEANWTRTRLCFEEEGHLGLGLKHMIAFCVAAVSGSDHLVRAFASRLRNLGTSDEDFAELLLVIDLTTGYNRYVQGLQADLEAKPFGADAEANLAASVMA